MSDVIDFEVRGAIGVITINNPPANALSFAVDKGLHEAVQRCTADDAIKAMVITGGGKMFVAGADISEFGKPRPDDVPELNDVIEGIEASDKPVVAALNGLALGGGLELAMSCHYRLAAPTIQVGQPEVKLGFIPGAGGTQRLPRLAGVEAALDMIVGGDPIKAQKALELGIVDELVEGDVVARAVEFAEEVAAKGGAPRRTGEQTDKISGVDKSVFDAYRRKIAPKSRGLAAPYECIRMVEVAATLPFAQGLEEERKAFVTLRDSDQAAAMRYMFFAEREVAKVPDVPRDVQPMKIASAAVVGSGTMGGGIAMCFANAGVPVTVTDISQEALDAGLAKVKANYEGSVSRGRLTQAQMDERLGLISGSVGYDGAKEADIVIEAVFEDMDLKKKIFADLDAVMKPEAILASNTSTLDINELAAVTKRPDKVVGTHFFSPANVMKLLENVRTETASKETIATVMQLSKVLGKVGVLVGVGDGFVGNRLLGFASRIAEFMVEEGALPWQVDKVLYDFGFPMGPFAVSDMAGVDIRYLSRQGQLKLYPGRRNPVLTDKLYEMGRLGQKTGKGWYLYKDGSRKGEPDPEIEKLIAETSKELGIDRRPFSDEEILANYLCALSNTGAHVLDEGLAIRASDIDVIWLYGYGFPRQHGGPMFHADLVGLDKVLAKTEAMFQLYGDWMKPAGLLKTFAAEGKKFKDYKAG